MMTRAEKLFCIRAQVAKAASEIEHGDTYASCMALGDALSGVIRFLEEELPPELTPRPDAAFGRVIEPEKANEPMSESIKRPLPPIHPKGEGVKAPDPETRAALDTLRAEPTKIKRR